MTDKKLKELIEKEENDVKYLSEYKNKNIKDIWIEELDEFLKQYKVWLSKQEYSQPTQKKNKK